MSILKLYAPFFDGNNWLHVLTSGKDWMIILTLIIMECLLSVDNAVVLAAQTQVLPTKSEKENISSPLLTKKHTKKDPHHLCVL